MDLHALKKYKPNLSFQVIEKDLSLDPNMRKKLTFSADDMKIDFSSERLERGEIEIPVFKEKTVKPLGIKCKLLDYNLEKMGGGCYKITYLKGKQEPKKNDRQHPQNIVKREDKKEFWIAWDREEKRYRHFEKEKGFNKIFEEIEGLLHDPEIEDLIEAFTTFISNLNMTVKQTRFDTVQDYLNFYHWMEKKEIMIEKYLLLLNVFEDITDVEYDYLTRNIENMSKRLKSAREYLEKTFPNREQALTLGFGGEKEDSPVIQFNNYFNEQILNPIYYYDQKKDGVYPNIMELYKREQFTPNFESNESRKEQILKKKGIVKTQGVSYFKYDY